MKNQETLPDHLKLLPDDSAGRWALWRTICVRGAGFPATDILKIADAECAAAADRLAAAEAESEKLRQAALEALRGELESAGKDRLDLLVKAIRRVKRLQPVTATEGLAAATAAAIDAWREAAGRAEAEKASYQAAFQAAEQRLDGVLREIAGNERFREAVLWQNRHAAETALASFLRRPAGEVGGSARDRGHAQMLASYLQRYCVKNDTVGFFGPVGWARWGDEVDGQAVVARPGKELLASREVYFEGWAIDAIADRLAEDEEIRPWLAPRLSPFLRKETPNLYIGPGGVQVQLGPLSSLLIAACDGTRPARLLLRELGPAVTPENEKALWGILADFHSKGIIRWSFQIPLTITPERTLRELLLQIDEGPVRDRALAVLDEVVRGRDAVARAAGNAGELERALGELEASFTRATGRPATWAAGEVYAGRTLVFEDCRRDLDLEFGPSFLAELAPALSLVLASARWFTHFMGTKHRAMMTQVYADLSQQATAPIDVLTFARAALPRLLNIQPNQELRRELESRWEKALAIPEGERRVHFRSEDLRPIVQREFAAPGPGWQKARHHSPDLLIAAPSVEAIGQGDYQVVLGEVHLALNSLDRWLFFSQHPNPDALRAAIESDLPEPSLIPVFPKIWNANQATSGLGLPSPAVNARMDVALHSAKDFYLDFSLDPPGYPKSQILAMGDLVVERGEGDSLVIGPRDGRVRFEVLDFFQLVLMMQALQTFRILPGSGAHTPRVTIDRLVVARENWNFPAGDLAFAQASTAAERFAAVRRWAAELDLPRFVFVKTPVERKPFYVDLESPVLVEIFAKAVRKATKNPQNPQDTRVDVSEMLPELDRVWLPDAEGNRYTCELRMVVLDLESPA